MSASERGGERDTPHLSLYIHVPWCASKCPYCDFNSHALRAEIPERPYVEALLDDLDWELTENQDPRPLSSVFVGGGTPSLLSGSAVSRLIAGIRSRALLLPGAEITLEANPGTADARNFAAYRRSGVNRLSIGAQSLSTAALKRLGRIHGPDEVQAAFRIARDAGFDNINLDLMYGLPGQDLAQARADLELALALEPEHLSYYQLTLEPNTAFFAAPPPLPNEDLIAELHAQGEELIASRGFGHYEVSAHARPGRRCRHNLNYWTFGDYLGVGAGAHGKRSDPATGRVQRSAKLRHPSAYLAAKKRDHRLSHRRQLGDDDLVIEFTMNALRLTEGFSIALFEQRTGLPFERIAPGLEAAQRNGLLERDGDLCRPTALGRLYLNDLICRVSDT